MNGFPSAPTRVCPNTAGPPSILTASQMIAISGMKMTRAIVVISKSKDRFTAQSFGNDLSLTPNDTKSLE